VARLYFRGIMRPDETDHFDEHPLGDGDDLIADPDSLDETIEAGEDGLEHRRITLQRVGTNRRLDKYLAQRIGRTITSRTALQRYIKEGNVTLNGKAVKPSATIRVGDVIDLMLPVVKRREIPPEDIPLDIVYEDEDVLAINKQTDIIVHPARGNWTGTIVNALAFYFQANWRDIGDLPVNGEEFRPGIVHRLDRNTTGIMLIAKTDLALWRLGHQFEHRRIQKTYTAMVHGLIELDEDIIDQPIGHHPKIREKYAVHHKTGRDFPAAVKDAITRYRVLERIRNVGPNNAGFTLVEMYPKTGRTHQLRVHMSYLGHPMIGDNMYGGGPLYISQLEGRNDVAEGPLMVRQALHAHTIEFNHPRSDERIMLEAPWPEDFQRTLAELRQRGQSTLVHLDDQHGLSHTS
jgi:23S rRNA pseudouridine1911/1915/1917 synthase